MFRTIQLKQESKRLGFSGCFLFLFRDSTSTLSLLSSLNRTKIPARLEKLFFFESTQIHAGGCAEITSRERLAPSTSISLLNVWWMFHPKLVNIDEPSKRSLKVIKFYDFFMCFCRCRGCSFVYEMLFSSLFHRLTFLFDCMHADG